MAELNDEVDERSAIVAVKGDGGATAASYQARHLVVRPETTPLLELLPTVEPHPGSVPTSAIQQITFVRRWRGAAEGFFFGLLAGTAAGAATGYAVETGPYQLFSAAVFALIGCAAAIPGALIGAGIGHRTSIDLDWTARPHRWESCLNAQIGVTAQDAEGTTLRCRQEQDARPFEHPVWKRQ